MLTKAFLLFVAVTFVAGALFCGSPGQPEPPAAEKPAEPVMTDEQKAEFVFANCVCAKCPSWTEECTAKGEKGGYCAIGKSGCIVEEKGCICPECPVTAKLGLKWGYYCTRGSAAEMMEQEKPAAEEGGA